jgi:outer membrane protein OmpA-like peptidoglycan-associated protein
VTFDFKKLIVRSVLGLTALAILLYIFIPSTSNPEDVEHLTTTTVDATATTVVPVDLPCTILFNRDQDTFLVPDNPCIDSYADKYLDGIYTKLQVSCRSSADGDRTNRQSLSDKRAKNVEFHLLKLGVVYEDIVSISLGDTSPVPGIDPSSEEGKLLNRSCEISNYSE